MTHKLLAKAVSSTALIAALMTPFAAQAQDISVSTSIDYVSEYVFRGVSFESEAIQPGVEVGLGNFSAGIWASTGIGSDSLADTDEIDFYASYGFDVSDAVSASVGATLYNFPDASDSFEVNGGVALNTVLSPSVTAYYDFDLEAFTLEGGLGHSLPVGPKSSLDLGVTAGLVDAPDGGSYEYGLASASLGYGFTDDVSAYVGANYSISSEDTLDFDPTLGAGTDDNLFWVGVGVAAGF